MGGGGNTTISYEGDDGNSDAIVALVVVRALAVAGQCSKPPRYVPYKGTYVPYDGTFGAPDQGQTLDV